MSLQIIGRMESSNNPEREHFSIRIPTPQEFHNMFDKGDIAYRGRKE
jgi:hypothetical protein